MCASGSAGGVTVVGASPPGGSLLTLLVLPRKGDGKLVTAGRNESLSFLNSAEGRFRVDKQGFPTCQVCFRGVTW